MSRPKLAELPSARRGWRLLLGVKRNPLLYFTRLMNEVGAYAWLNIGGRPTVMLNDATGIEYVLQTNNRNFIKGHFQHIMEPVFGESILMQEGEGWRQRRHMAAPVFSHGNFQGFIDQMVPAVDAMCRRIDSRIAAKQPVDVSTEMTRFTLDAMLRALFHAKDDDQADEVRLSLGVLLKDIEARLWTPLKLPTAIATRLPGYNKAFGFLEAVVKQLIAKRQADQAYPEDLLSRMVNGYGYNPREQKLLFDETLSYLLAGHETTAHTLAWAIYVLTLHPGLKQRFEAEVKEKLSEASPRMDDITALHYGRNFLNEVMRLYPPVWTMSREAIQPDSIPLDDGSTIEVEAGDTVMMCQYAVHRREAYWPNPEGFDPDRFTADALNGRGKYTWFPFGAGPRICIGARFAQVETLLALALLVRRYDFSLVAGQEIAPEPMITLRPRGEILVKFTRLNAEDVALKAASAQVADTASQCPYHHRATNKSLA